MEAGLCSGLGAPREVEEVLFIQLFNRSVGGGRLCAGRQRL